MQKTKTFKNKFFRAAVVKEMYTRLSAMAKHGEKKPTEMRVMSIDAASGSWEFDDLQEFLSEYKPEVDHVFFHSTIGKYKLQLSFLPDSRISEISVAAPTRSEIEEVFNICEEHVPDSQLPPPKEPAPVVFIGHGRSALWRDLKDHLQDKHDYLVEAYEIGSRAGHTIRDILEEMLKESSCAFLVLTGEDETPDGKLHARQNVVHETGLFQGRLGFSRAIALLEHGTEEFSNLAGIQQIRFSKGNIKETFAEVLAVLRREFGK